MDLYERIFVILGGISSCLTIIDFIVGKNKKESEVGMSIQSNRVLILAFLTIIFFAIGFSKNAIILIAGIKPEMDFTWSYSRAAYTRAIIIYAIELVFTVAWYIFMRIDNGHTSLVIVLFSIIMILFVAPINAIWLGFRVLNHLSFESWCLTSSFLGSYVGLYIFISLILYSRE